MKRFVILSHARTGSTLLVDTLDRHPDLCVYGELFNPDEHDRQTVYHVDGRPWRGEDGAAFVRDVVYRERAGVAAVGFKYMYDHAERPGSATALDHLASRHDVHAILLTRQDLLATLVSLERALRSGVWQMPRGAGAWLGELPPFRLEPEHCLRFFRRVERITAELQARFSGHALLELEYGRDIVGDLGATLARVQAFLGVDIVPLEPALAKLPVRDVREQIQNYEELRRELSGTAYGRWLQG